MLHAAGLLTIDRQAVRDNYALLTKRLRHGCRSGAVVKANGYGLGAIEIAQTLLSAGCRDFFVAKPAEGTALRTAIPDPDVTIYILNGFYGSQEDDYITHHLTPVLGSFIEIEGWRALGQKTGRALPAALKFNIRMNRLGLGQMETKELLANPSMLNGMDMRLVMSHFACADEPDHEMTTLQHRIFDEIAAHFPNAEKSLCNSPGIFRDPAFHYDLVRPGMALYGLNPTPEAKNPMRPVVSLSLPVTRTRIVYPGAIVGYGATYRFEKEAPLATVAAGYADGIFRSLSNHGALYWQGIRCPIRGRISMDLTTVDLSDVPPEQRPKPGDQMELLGEHQSADDLAHDAGTIGYEVLTALGQRYQRQYIN